MAMSVVRRIGVLSLAKMQAAVYALLGLIGGAVFALLSLFGAAIGSGLASGSDSHPIFGMIFGIGAVVIFPIFYGGMGFIIGLIGGAIYNLVAGAVGGIEIELE